MLVAWTVLLFASTLVESTLVGEQQCQAFGTPASGCLYPPHWRFVTDPQTGCRDCFVTQGEDATYCYTSTTTGLPSQGAYIFIPDFNSGLYSMELSASFQLRYDNSNGNGGGFSFNWGPDVPEDPQPTNSAGNSLVVDASGYGNGGTVFQQGISFFASITGASSFSLGISHLRQHTINSFGFSPALSSPDWSTVYMEIIVDPTSGDAACNLTWVVGSQTATVTHTYSAATIYRWLGTGGNFLLALVNGANQHGQYDVTNIQIGLDDSHLGCCGNNDECVNWPGTQCSPDTFDCIEPPCSTSDDCPIDQPHCTPAGQWSAACGNCGDDTDCYPWPGTLCNTSSGGCVTPGCVDNDDCTDSSASYCANGGQYIASCETCEDDTQCYTWEGTVCFPANNNDQQGRLGCAAPDCFNNLDCNNQTVPLCNYSGQWESVCVGCSTTDDCYAWPNTFCYEGSHGSWSAGACAPIDCWNNDDCALSTAPHCYNEGQWDATCGNCVNDGDCYQWPGTLCNTAAGSCVAPGCHVDDDCKTEALSWCQDAGLWNGTCAVCVADIQCTLWPGTVCYPTGVNDPRNRTGCAVPDCTLNVDCLDQTLPLCTLPGKWNASCQGCENWNDCYAWPDTVCYEHNFPYDNTIWPVGSCAPPECWNNDDCNQTSPYCKYPSQWNSECTKCQQDGDCFQWAGTFCDGSGACVLPECVDDDDCTDPTASYCLNGGTSLGTCKTCLNDTQCYLWEGTVCYPSVRDEPDVIYALGCAPPVCSTNLDCNSNYSSCYEPGTNSAMCIQCSTLNDCYPFPGTVCYETTNNAAPYPLGSCSPPLCYNNDDCTDPENPLCFNGSTYNSYCGGCQVDGDCFQWAGSVCYPDGQCAPPSCTRGGFECTEDAPVCYMEGEWNSYCGNCTDDTGCYRYPLYVCALGGDFYGQCIGPACRNNADCSPAAPVCERSQVWDSQCTVCNSPGVNPQDACALYPSTPYCDFDTGLCHTGCYSDADCGGGDSSLTKCNNSNSCVECTSSYECYAKDQSKPICGDDQVCRWCQHGDECGAITLFQACHTQWADDGSQVVGICVIDTYNKGFQIAALILGSIATFGVIVALIGLLFVAKRD